MVALDGILEHLKDGKRHSIKEISETLNLREETVKEILNFLADYNFVILDEKRGEVFLDPKLKRLIRN